MDLTLRPRGATEIVDFGVRLLRRHLRAFFTLSLIAVAPQLVFQLFLVAAGGAAGAGGSDLLTLAELSTAAVTVGLPLFVLYSAAAAGAFAALADDAVRTDAADVGASVRAGLRRALPAFGTLLLFGLASGAAALLFLVPGAYVAARLITAVPTCVIEEVGPFDALARAWARGRGRVLHAVAVLLLAFLVVLAAVVLSSFVAGAIGAALGAGAGAVVAALLQLLATAVVQPVIPIATQLLYYDQRVRGEGLDVEEMVVGLPPAAVR